MRDGSSNRVLVIKDDGEYSSSSDFNDDIFSLLAADHAGNDDHPEEHNKEPHHLPSLLHLQAEQETYNVTAAKGLDMLCVIAPPRMFWS
jgi:hypothetical protein